jgi:type IV pilus assembly protein PilA
MIVVAIIGLLASLAIPNFLRFQARAKQSEARAGLKSIFTGQKSYYGDKEMYLDLLDVIGYNPEFNNRYSYYGGGGGTQVRTATVGTVTTTAAASVSCTTLSGTGYISVDESKWGSGATSAFGTTAPTTVAPRTIVTGGNSTAMTTVAVLPTGCCPAGLCDFMAAAVGNIDNDSSWDIWSISSQPAASGTTSCPGAGTGTWNVAAEGEPINECNDVNM